MWCPPVQRVCNWSMVQIKVGWAAELSMWVVPMKNLPNLLCQCQTAYFAVAIDSCFELLARLRWCRQHVHWNLNMWRNVMFSNESRFCLRQLDRGVEVWRRRGERYAVCCIDRVTSFGGGSVMVWGGISLTGKTRQSQCREISRWDSATSGNPISPQSGTELYPPRWQRSPPQSGVYQRLPPEFGSGEDVMACQQSWPQPHWTLVGSVWACCSCQSDQHNHVGWLVTNAGWRMGCHPTAVCDQAGDQHEEEVPGCCGCVWFFHTLLRLLFVKWINC